MVTDRSNQGRDEKGVRGSEIEGENDKSFIEMNNDDIENNDDDEGNNGVTNSANLVAETLKTFGINMTAFM